MSMEKIATILSISAAALTVLAILVAAVVCTVRLIKKAKSKNSPGGEKITVEEAIDIVMAILPFGVKILHAISKNKESADPTPQKEEESAEPEKIEPEEFKRSY